MKKIKSIVLLSFISIILISCDKIDKLLTFNVSDTAVFTIPSSTGINLPLSIPVPTITSSASKTFENNNTHASLVKNVVLQDLKLTIQNPSSKTFKFLKSIEIYISAPGEKEVLLATLYDIPTTAGNSISLNSAENKLDAYLKKDSYSISTLVEVREVPGENVTVKADMRFSVTANTY